ncbi:MAG TPA: hypothetical protein VHP56_04320 [Solirubrobacterales bacterium]|jgi:hypothetical protein|nr:hypothetical protein [Solirubrobacterales bacterium]
MNFDFAAVLAAAAPPAGGAEIGQIVIATTAATIVTAALLYLGLGHRSGRVQILQRLADHSERTSGMPGWVAFPSGIATLSLLTAVFGMYWDISIHIDNGRDAGPLANPAHYFILAGLFGIFSAGFFAMVLPKEKPSTVAIRIGRDWWAPLGGVLICACGAFSLIGFPLDDVWHRLFGQDVTLWGPTHLMLIGGAAMTLVGIAVLTVEGMRANAAAEKPLVELAHTRLARAVALTGGLMLGLSTFQAEFDFGVPQFQLIFQPLMLMVAAGVGLTLARVYAGPGAALGAAGFFILLRGILALAVGPVLGQTTPHFPLYLAEAAVVEAVALFISTQKPLRFGLVSGIGIGTVGLAAEWAWSHLWMPLPWPEAAFPEAAIVGLAAAIAGTTIGAWIGAHLAAEPAERSPQLRRAALCSAAVLAALVAYGLYTPTQEGVSAQVALHDVGGGNGREVEATVRISPPDAATDAEWFDVTAWQGGGLVVDPLQRTAPGVYRTTEPIPVHGNWKAMIRLHDDNALTALPIFLPRDEAIPVGETPAPASFTRSFGDEHQLLQREQKGGSPLLVAIAYSTVAGIALSLLALLAWALHRLAVGMRPSPRRRRLRLRSLPGFQHGGGR